MQSEINPAEREVLEALETLGIPFQRFEHPPVYTVEQAQEYWAGIPAVHCKNLFLRNKKGDTHYLVVVAAAKRIDLKALGNHIGAEKVSFASEDRLTRYLGLSAGAVSPFGLIHDRSGAVRLLFDADLRTADKIAFHPNVNTATITLTFPDFERFVAWSGHSLQFITV